MKKITPFHIAVPVHDLEKARVFYRDVIGCEEGRSDTHWVDFNMYGHQFVIHYKEREEDQNQHHNEVDGHAVPVPHYGVVLEWDDWEALAGKLKKNNVLFIIEPYIRFEGQTGEQGTMFFNDPSGNALEFNSFRDINQLFAK